MDCRKEVQNYWNRQLFNIQFSFQNSACSQNTPFRKRKHSGMPRAQFSGGRDLFLPVLASEN